jgi:hypothetical protein
MIIRDWRSPERGQAKHLTQSRSSQIAEYALFVEGEFAAADRYRTVSSGLPAACICFALVQGVG